MPISILRLFHRQGTLGLDGGSAFGADVESFAGGGGGGWLTFVFWRG